MYDDKAQAFYKLIAHNSHERMMIFYKNTNN